MSKKVLKKFFLIGVVLTLLLPMLAACGAAKSATSSSAKTANTAKSTKKNADKVTIKDAADRKVEIPAPDKIKKVFFTSPLGMIYIYTLVPDKLAGLPYDLRPGEKKYLLPQLQKLENLGGMQSGSKMNIEKIVESGAQIIFSIGPNKIDDNAISEADKLQNQTKIPVVTVDGSMEKVEESYQLLGKIFGKEKEAKKLSDYCEKVLKDVKEKVATIPEDKRVSVYYAEQADGLTTEPETSSHAAALKIAGAKNVASVEEKAGSGMSKVSLEQVITWNPEVIITWGEDMGGAYSKITTDPNWANIKAVKDGRVYVMPGSPYNWIDRPPSVNRFLGIQWIANLLYPDVYKIDIVKQTKEFYSLFYHKDLTDDEVNELLAHSVNQAE
ncbi:MAG: ABC transporter substrate-binding protein [Enterococcaceae bacterium]|jgi:iron complex transport system substrate-binding protein|nr:ABC transporter substrate-binding protein [Enterococcaceae bacterium]